MVGRLCVVSLPSWQDPLARTVGGQRKHQKNNAYVAFDRLPRAHGYTFALVQEAKVNEEKGSGHSTDCWDFCGGRLASLLLMNPLCHLWWR